MLSYWSELQVHRFHRFFYFLNRQIVPSALVATIALEGTFAALIWTHKIDFDSKLSWTLLIAAPGFGLTILGLCQSVMIQRGAFVKDYIAQFFLKPELYGTWHDLIYDFSDDLFIAVTEFVNANDLQSQKHRPILLALDEQGRKQWGNLVIYHPLIFQGSDEEKRLDALMGYLNVIGYYHYRGLVSTNDIYTSLGYFLLLINDREVVKKYRSMIIDSWPKDKKFYRVVPGEPYSYLGELLVAVAKHRDWAK